MVATDQRSPKGDARRERILAEARRMLLDEGYPRLTLRQIATQLRISVGNLQYYFSTKDDLVEAVLTREIDASLEILHRTAWDADDPVASTKTAVRALLHHHATDSGRFYAIAESLALYDPRYANLKARGYANVLGDIEQLVAEMVPRLNGDQRRRLARVLVTLIDGASLQVQFGHVGAPTDAVDALADDVATAISHLIETWD
ncbi:MAG: TetR/AcrR family transcriptional regulator [Pseudomonadota bacterium]